MRFTSVQLKPVQPVEESKFQALMRAHHYLGALPKIGNTIWYVALSDGQWLSLQSFSASALRCSARDHWAGWGFRHHYDLLHLVANNSRLLILPDCHHKNLALHVLALCKHRIQQDWLDYFGFPLLLETFVDPEHFQGTIYLASNWILVGSTQGYRRIQCGYSEQTDSRTAKHVVTTGLVTSRPRSINWCRLMCRCVRHNSAAS